MSTIYATTRNAIGSWIREMIIQGHAGGTVWTPINPRPRARKESMPTTGYVVGGGVVPQYVDLTRGYGELYATITAMLADAALSGAVVDGVGFWRDSDGQIVLDVVQWVEAFPGAIALADKRDEEEVYSITDGECYVTSEWAHIVTMDTYPG